MCKRLIAFVALITFEKKKKCLIEVSFWNFKAETQLFPIAIEIVFIYFFSILYMIHKFNYEIKILKNNKFDIIKQSNSEFVCWVLQKNKCFNSCQHLENISRKY